MSGRHAQRSIVRLAGLATGLTSTGSSVSSTGAAWVLQLNSRLLSSHECSTSGHAPEPQHVTAVSACSGLTGSHCSTFATKSMRLSVLIGGAPRLAALSYMSGTSSTQVGHQTRSYGSNKRSIKPLNSAASWAAVRPFLLQQAVKEGRLRRRRPVGPLLDTALPEIPEVPCPALYRRIGRITAPYQLALEPIFSVVEIGGTQFKVTTDDIIFVNQLPHVDINDVLSLDRVLLMGTKTQTVVGRPYVPGAQVLVAVEEHFRDGKVHVLKYKKRKRYRKYQAPRQNLTTLRVLKVLGGDVQEGAVQALLPGALQLESDDNESQAGLGADSDDAAAAGL